MKNETRHKNFERNQHIEMDGAKMEAEVKKECSMNRVNLLSINYKHTHTKQT